MLYYTGNLLLPIMEKESHLNNQKVCMVPIKMFDGRLRQNEASKGMMTDMRISKTKASERSHEKIKIPVKKESKHGHDKQVKGKSKKVINVEETITQERKEEIVEESHYTCKTSRIHENVKQGNKDKEQIFPINIKLQASEKYPAKYYEPENKDDNRTLSHGKRLRKSTFTGEFENRDRENA